MKSSKKSPDQKLRPHIGIDVRFFGPHTGGGLGRYTEELVYTNKNRKANNTQRQLTNFGLDLDEYDNIENENKRYLTQNTTTTTTTVQG